MFVGRNGCDHVVVEAFEVQSRKPFSGWASVFNSNHSNVAHTRDGNDASSASSEQQPVSLVPPAAFVGLTTSSLDLVARIALPSFTNVTSAVNEALATRGGREMVDWTEWYLADASSMEKGAAPVSSEQDALWAYAYDFAHPFTDVRSHSTVMEDQEVWSRRRLWRCDGFVTSDFSSTPLKDCLSDCPWVAKIEVRQLPTEVADSSQPQQQQLEDAPLPPVSRHHRTSSTTSVGSMMSGVSSCRTPTSGRQCLVPVSHWMKDKDAQKCLHCKKAFNLVVRRHHCRLCGQVYCAACCQKSKAYGDVRVCTPCCEAEKASQEAAERDMEREEATLTSLNTHLVSVSVSHNDLLLKVLQQLESDVRIELIREANDEFTFLTSLSATEVDALNDICALVRLPSLIQLSDSLHVRQLERTLKLSDFGSLVQNRSIVSVLSSTLPPAPVHATDVDVGATSNTSMVLQHSSTLNPSPPQALVCNTSIVTSNVSLCMTAPSNQGGCLLLRFLECNPKVIDPRTQIRLDARIEDGPLLVGEWSCASQAQLYIAVSELSDTIEVIMSCQPGSQQSAALGAMVGVLWNTPIVYAKAKISIAGDLLQDPDAKHLEDTTTGSGKLTFREDLFTKRILGDIPFAWKFDRRSLFDQIEFCANCGMLKRRCECITGPQTDENQGQLQHPIREEESHIAATPIVSVQPDVAADSTVNCHPAHPKPLLPSNELAVPAQTPPIAQPLPDDALVSFITTAPPPPTLPSAQRIIPSATLSCEDRVRLQSAYESLISCASQRLLLEKQSMMRTVEAEEREAYGALRGVYFRSTNAALSQDARRRRRPQVEASLQIIAQVVLVGLAKNYLSRWNRRAAQHGPQRRLEAARARLEKRVGLVEAKTPLHNSPLVADTQTSSVNRGTPAARSPIEAVERKTSSRKKTSERCCTVM